MKKFLILCVGVLVWATSTAFALSERHLIIVRTAEAGHNISGTFNSDQKHVNYKVSNLTHKGREQAQKTAERLAEHGFDNRSLSAVYVSPLPRAIQMAQIMSDFGIFDRSKIHIDDRLVNNRAGALEGEVVEKYTHDAWHLTAEDIEKYNVESNLKVRKRMLGLYDDIEKNHPKGHVLIISHGMPAMELLQDIIQIEVRLSPGDAYLLPLIARNSKSKFVSHG